MKSPRTIKWDHCNEIGNTYEQINKLDNNALLIITATENVKNGNITNTRKLKTIKTGF